MGPQILKSGASSLCPSETRWRRPSLLCDTSKSSVEQSGYHYPKSKQTPRSLPWACKPRVPGGSRSYTSGVTQSNLQGSGAVQASFHSEGDKCPLWRARQCPQSRVCVSCAPGDAGGPWRFRSQEGMHCLLDAAIQ